VALDGDTALVGAFLDDTGAGVDAGSAYVFVRSGDTWMTQAWLTAPDGQAGDAFGLGLAVAGDTAVLGASGDDTAAGSDAGSAYVFTRAAGLWTL
jgi:hypothetical protein